jgi:ribosomal protein S18 acetylase RimI-like enzyme
MSAEAPRIRAATQDDLDRLWDFLAIAAQEPDRAAAQRIPVVAAHLAGWQRASDFGFIAERGGLALGAAWARQFTRAEQPAFFLDELTPEVSIGVAASARGQGIGTALLQALHSEARSRGCALCLDVRETNPALRLYERVGYRRVPGATIRNRAGGWSVGMVWRPGA